MAKVKQPLEENGIHRAKMWEIMMYALNNTSTNRVKVNTINFNCFINLFFRVCKDINSNSQ